MLLGQDWDFAHVDTQINFLNSKLVLAFMETWGPKPESKIIWVISLELDYNTVFFQHQPLSLFMLI